MKLSLVFFCAASFAASVVGTEVVTSEKLQNDVTEVELMKNLNRLNQIARNNSGNRAFGFPGFEASVKYVFERTSRFSHTIDTWIQDFPALFNKVKSISFKVGETDYYIYGLTYSPSTTPEGVTLPLVLGPEGTAACRVDGYAGLDVKGKIVLVERGTCPTGGTLAGRVRPAKLAGASNVIIYNNVPTKVTGGTLSAPDPKGYVSSGFINQVDGVALKERLLAGEQIMAYFQQTQVIETRITQNVFAETKGGDPNNIIMLGAHLDSVQAGPGINDDGSGTSLILELITGLKKYDVKNKVRFAWWGAEENGLLGSRYYTSNLNQTEVDKILVYLNFDMVSKGYFGVFDGDGSTHGLAAPPGSEVIEKLFVDDLTSKGITVTPAVFTGGSDYAPFMDTLRKPIGGLHTGTGVAQDPCYHQACDDYSNPNSTVLTVNAKTAAHVLAVLAQEGHNLIPKNRTSTPARRDITDIVQWTVIEGERHVGTCGHDV
ncbi:Zn-dependent exopeptidase [Choiromyces venosus 120613-1]|uniref:Peptide hydrolase n=1 Tax=Choiromyces venosus 120613-1 TaxID=1336337 RepID=A0A3N4JFV4_9PEZI|nr:Zn-dependent exopeptidase [Choiromyces venosus 120613-1]